MVRCEHVQLHIIITEAWRRLIGNTQFNTQFSGNSCIIPMLPLHVRPGHASNLLTLPPSPPPHQFLKFGENLPLAVLATICTFMIDRLLQLSKIVFYSTL